MPKQPTQQFNLPERPYKKIAISFIVLTLLLSVIIVYFSLSKAEIILIPKEVTAEKSFNFKIPLNSTSTDIELSGNLEEKEIEITKSFDVQTQETKQGKSHGKVTIVNNHNQSQTLVSSTRFLSPDGLLFRLTKNVTIPAQKEVEAEIEADQIGAKHDIGPARFTIPGLSLDLQKKIYGISKQAMNGGVIKISTLKAEEISSAKEQMNNSLNQLIAEQLNLNKDNQEQENEQIVLIDKQILSENISNKQGDVLEKFTIGLKIKVSIISLNKEKILTATKEAYKKEIDNLNVITNYDLESFKVELQNITESIAEINTSINAYALGTLNIENFEKQKIFGLDKEGVKYFFSQYNDVKDIKVKFWPFWVRSVPSLPDHIEIKIE